MLSSALIVCLELAAPPQAPQQVPAPVVQEIPMFLLAPGKSAPTGVELPRTPIVVNKNDSGDRAGWEGLGRVSGDDVAVGLQSLFARAVEDGQLNIDFRHERQSLVLRGEQALVEAAALAAGWLEAEIARPMRVDLRVYSLDAIPRTATTIGVDPREVLGSGAKLIWSGSAVTTLHQSAVFEDLVSHPQIFDYDVEVAQKAHIEDPIVGALLSGVHVVVSPFGIERADGDIGVTIDASVSARLGGDRSNSTGVHESPVLDSAMAMRSAFVASARLQSGSSCFLWCGGDASEGPNMAIQCQVTWLGTAPRQRDDAALVPLAFARPGLETRIATQEGSAEFDPASPGLPGGAVALPSARSIWQPDELLDALGPEESDDLRLQRIGSYLLIAGAKDSVQRVRAFVAQSITGRIRNQQVDFDCSAGDSEVAIHVGRLPTLLGMPAMFRRGIHGTSIRDFDVEIAQSAVAMNPIVGTWFAGALVHAVVAPRAGGIATSLMVSVNGRDREARRSLESKVGGAFDATAMAVRRQQLRIPVEPGVALELGDGPKVRLGEDAVATKLRVTVR
ncbi:MAG: hypothetical protein AB7I19_13465 [Planctomycetota bacterium]